MESKYIRFTKQEIDYGKKELLHLELESLLMSKKFEELAKLRKEKIITKTELVKKILPVKKALVNFSNQLPEIAKNIEKNQEPKAKKPEETLDAQINEIKEKLMKLQQIP